MITPVRGHHPREALAGLDRHGDRAAPTPGPDTDRLTSAKGSCRTVRSPIRALRARRKTCGYGADNP